jgi:hypothetical protein
MGSQKQHLLFEQPLYAIDRSHELVGNDAQRFLFTRPFFSEWPSPDLLPQV